MAKLYAQSYDLLEFAGSDNHCAGDKKILAGMKGEVAVQSEKHFVELIKDGYMNVFTLYC